MPADPRQALGRDGEKAAEKFLRKLGYRILGRNIRFPFGELDLVALDGEMLVFVEVKAGRSADALHPADHVTPAKRRRMRRAAEHFMQIKRIEHLAARFDVLSVLLPERGRATVEHFRDVD